MPELSRFFGIIIRMYRERSIFTHPIYRIRAAQVIRPYTLRIAFDDHSEQTIDFQSVLVGEMYAPLRDLTLFNQVRIDPEVHTLVWPDGADFDPTTLHDWPQQAAELSGRVREWQNAPSRSFEPPFQVEVMNGR